MFTKIYLIRHGETEGAETKRYKGHIDVPLSENGIEQIKRLAEYLSAEVQKRGSAEAAYELSAIYTSDLSRAVKSAELIAKPHGIKPMVLPELRERNFGTWEGMSFDEIKEKWPDAFNSWSSNPLKFCPMGGESTIEVRDRAVKAFNKIIEQHNGHNIAIVSHGGINRVMLCELLGMPLENIFRVEQDYACINIVEMWDKYPVVKLINGEIK
jgi:alpha-ribazole phosphatase/probable phosphoglycerate mutase